MWLSAYQVFKCVLIFGLAFVWCPSVSAQGATCEFDFDAVPEDHYHPFLVRAARREMVYPELTPNERRLVKVEEGVDLLVGCPGRRNALRLTNNKIATLACSRGRLALHTDTGLQEVSWKDLGCLRRCRPSRQIPRGAFCGQNGRRYNIGWSLQPGLFIPQIMMCFDSQKETTEFTYHRIQGSSIDAKTVEPSRPSFKIGSMFSSDIASNFRKQSQQQLALRILGSSEYLSGKGQHYLARGHLAPDSDFVYAAEQDATYYYGNVLPQWQGVNNGNWKSLEFSIRELAVSRDAKLDVWTGGAGVLRLPDQNLTPVELFLGLTEDKKVVPVPAWLWKVVHDPKTRHAVAIIEVNDVSGEGTSAEDNIYKPPCVDLCHRLTWVDWDIYDGSRGVTFCCHVDDELRSIIPALPQLGQVELLV